MLGESGLRCESEGLWVRWTDIDFQKNELVVETVRKGVRSKSGKIRIVPMTRRLREALMEHAAQHRMAIHHGQRTPWVFHHLTDRGKGTAGERSKSMRDAFQRAVERAEIPADKKALVQHDLRHRRVTSWLEEGHPIHVVQHAMGHSSVTVTEGYLHLTSRSLQQLVIEGTAAMKMEAVAR
jgi:integrase/recombinase XerD